MAATLYEPAFVIVGRAYEDPDTRLRALAAITLFGGLASTVFFPATSLLEARFGWRGAVVTLAGALLASALLTRQFTFRELAHRSGGERAAAEQLRPAGTHAPGFTLLAGMFTLTAMVSGALATNLVPALGERGVAPAAAALVGGLMGAMQLPGRAVLMQGTRGVGPVSLLALSLAVHAAGLGLIAFGPSALIVAVGTMVFALGAGVTTLLRPHLVQAMFDRESVGLLNGRIARQQQIARAAGPILVAWFASRFGYAAVMAFLAATFLLTVPAALAALRGSRKDEQSAEAA